MDHAKDGAGRLIGTHQAVARRFYTCPVCSADVFLRRGHKYEHHFAHRSGHGKPECENFHPSDLIATTWANSHGNAPSPRAIAPLSVSIELEPEALIRGKRFRRWGLRLTIPKSDDEHGRITIDFGAGSPKTLALSRLSLESYTAVAGLNAHDFGASWISPEVRPNYRHAIEQRIPGLNQSQVNVFATSKQKYKPRVSNLTWGNSYYFVWRAASLNDLHTSLSVLPLAPQDEWRCALVTLPADEEGDAKAWLEEHVGLEFNIQRRAFGVIHPAPCGVDIYGRPLIPDAGKLLIGLNLGDPTDNRNNNLFCAIGQDHASVAIGTSGRHLFEIETALGKGVLDLRTDEHPLPQLVSLIDSAKEVLEPVTIEYRPPDASQSRFADLHRRLGVSALRTARKNRATIIGVRCPRGVGGTVSWRAPPDIEWRESFLLASVTGKVTSDELVEVNRCFQDQTLDVQFDFGAFGTFYDGGTDKSVPAQSAAFSSDLRKRIIWICKSANQLTDSEKTPIENLPDTALAAIFEALSVPAALVAHKHGITHVLRRTTGRTAS